MTREKLIAEYRAITLIEDDKEEFFLCALILCNLRNNVRGSVSWARLHLRSRRNSATYRRLIDAHRPLATAV